MGNSAVTLAVSTRGNKFVAGDSINGTVYVNVVSKNVNINSLKICLKGEEKTVVHYTTTHTYRDSNGRSHTRTHHHYARSSRNIFRMDHVLTTFSNGVLSPGQYEFPFEAHLPPGLPSTMYCDYSRSKCEIRYSVEAYYDGNKGKSARQFEVSAKRRPNNFLEGPVVCPPDTQAVNFCCCFNKGTMTLRAQVDQGVVSRGDKMDVAFACKNDSTVDMLGVDVKLEEIIWWSAQGRREQTVRNIMSETFTLDRIRAKTSELHEPLQQLIHSQLMVPSSTRETYDGTLINVKHQLTVTANTKCCITNPQVIMLVYVQPSADNQSYGLPMPPATNPEEEPEFKIEYDSVPPGWNPHMASNVEIPMAYVVGSDDDPYASASAPSFDSPYVPSAPPLDSPSAPSAPPLYETNTQYTGTNGSIDPIVYRMKHTLDPIELIDQLSTDPKFQDTIKNLSPDQFAILVGNVKSVFDQPRFAKCVAEKMDGRLTCAHVTAVCKHGGVSVLYRTNIVNAIAPLVNDLEANNHLIVQQLDGFEQLQCEHALGLG